MTSSWPRASAAPAARRSNGWGDGAAEIVEAWVEDAAGERREVVSQGAELTFKARARFVEPMSDPILGVTFKDEEGKAVFITNTLFDRVTTGNFDAGDEVTYTIRFLAHFGDGEYTASPAIAHEDARRMADWREDFVVFRLQGERHTGSVVDLPHQTEIASADGAHRSSAMRGSARR